MDVGMVFGIEALQFRVQGFVAGSGHSGITFGAFFNPGARIVAAQVSIGGISVRPEPQNSTWHNFSVLTTSLSHHHRYRFCRAVHRVIAPSSVQVPLPKLHLNDMSFGCCL